jgi:DNA-binding MarR family transcriptional regulator
LIAAWGGQRAIARTLGIEPKLVEHAIGRLEREGLLSPAPPGSGLPRDCYTLTRQYLGPRSH